MSYTEFLATCRQMAGTRTNREISKSDFARELGVDVHYYINMENGVKAPGRELLEKAAALAGIDFKDCLQIPGAPVKLNKHEQALEVFKEALNDWRERTTLKIALELSRMEKPKRQKRGGRPRKTA